MNRTTIIMAPASSCYHWHDLTTCQTEPIGSVDERSVRRCFGPHIILKTLQKPLGHEFQGIPAPLAGMVDYFKSPVGQSQVQANGSVCLAMEEPSPPRI